MDTIRAILVAGVLVMLAACNPFAPEEVANEAVEAFHARYNNGAYAEIFAEASPTFRQEVPRHELQRMLVGLSRYLGKVMRTEQREIAFARQETGPDLVTIVMRTEYEFGTVREEFTFSLGTSVLLEGYGFTVVRHDPARLQQQRGYVPPLPGEPTAPPERRPVELPPEVLEELPPEAAAQLRRAIDS